MARARRSLADAVREMARLQNSRPGPPAVTSRKSRVLRRSWTSYDLQTTIFAGLLGLAQIFAFLCIFLPSEESNFRFQPHLFVSARSGGERSATTVNGTTLDDEGPDEATEVLPSGYFLHQGEGSWSAVETNSPQPADQRFVSVDHSGTSSTLEDAAEIVPDGDDLSEHRHDEDADSAADKVDENGYREQHVEQLLQQHQEFPSAMASSFTSRRRETVSRSYRLGLTVVPWGVLGTRGGSKQPGSSTVFVDPAGLPFIQGDAPVGKAGGASGFIYKFLDKHRDKRRHEPDVATVFRSEIKKHVKSAGDAWVHKYGSTTTVIHAVGPNFGIDKSSPKHQLAKTYENIFLQAAAARKKDPTLKHLRLLPVSSGVFNTCGKSKCFEDFPSMTVDAILMAWKRISRDDQRIIAQEFDSVALCIFEGKSLADEYEGQVRRHTTLHEQEPKATGRDNNEAPAATSPGTTSPTPTSETAETAAPAPGTMSCC